MADIELLQPNGRNDKPNIWRAWTDHNKVHVEWGQQGGKLQRTMQEFESVNEGKSNVRTPEQAAKDALKRAVRLKRREGYMEEITQTLPTSIDFDNLPSNLCFYKPQTSMSKGLEKIADDCKAVFTRKRDGEMFAIVVNSKGEIDIYSRRMHRSHDDENKPWYNRFPHIVSSIEALGLPKKTILLAEMIFDRDGKDDFRHVTTVTRSLTDRALAVQKKDGWLTAYVWDVAFIDGAPSCVTETYEKRLDWIQARIAGKGLLPVHSEKFGSVERALAAAKARKWEGWVVVNPKAVYEDRAFNLKGKPDRPAHCGKLKPLIEADFLVEFDPSEKLGSYGTGKRAKGVGAVAVFAKTDTGDLRYVGDCGTGLTDAQVKGFADSRKFKFPMVWEIGFSHFTPKGILWHPRFLRVRDDKELDEIHLFEESEAAE